MFTNTKTGKNYEIQGWVAATQGLYAERTGGPDGKKVFYVLVVGWAHLEVWAADMSEPIDEEVWPITIVDAAKPPTEWRPVRKLTTNPNRDMEIVR